MFDKDINKVILILEDILQNKSNSSIIELGGYIVGNLDFRDDADELFEHYPHLSRIAAYAEELEMVEGDKKHAVELFNAIKDELSNLKKELNI